MSGFIDEKYDVESTMRFISENRSLRDSALIALLASKALMVDSEYAINQIVGRKIAKSKLPSWSECDKIIYPNHLSMEQCSSEETSQFKTTLVSGSSLLDLTGGFGVDFAFMSRKVEKAIMVERQPSLCEIAKHNFEVLGYENVSVVSTDAEEYLNRLKPNSVDTIYLDPARRDFNGNRVFDIDDCCPNIRQLAPKLLQCANRQVIVKLSPMFDINRAISRLPSVRNVYVVAVHGECKELLVVMVPDYNGEIIITCKNDDEVFEFRWNEQCASLPLWDCYSKSITEQYLYEPNATIMKAGCFTNLAMRYPILAVDKNSHLFLSEKLIDDFPGRRFKINSISTFNKQELKKSLKGVDSANIAVRNFPLSPDELRKRLKLKDGGSSYIFATTAKTGKFLFITEKI